jgi:hypothetical protein
MSFPPHLLDELARAFARAALERFLEESSARKPRQEEENGDLGRDVSPPTGDDLVEGDNGS